MKMDNLNRKHKICTSNDNHCNDHHCNDYHCNEYHYRPAFADLQKHVLVVMMNTLDSLLD